MKDPVFGRLLVAYDGSENAQRACESAVALARGYGAEVTLLNVIPPLSIFTGPIADEYYSIQQERAKSLIRKGMVPFEKAGVKAVADAVKAHWSVVETIISYADEHGCGLIVMGARGAGGFEKLLVGSVSSGVVSTARCPVLIVR